MPEEKRFLELGQTITFGGDPEFFLKKGKDIVASEELIPIDGLPLDKSFRQTNLGYGKLVDFPLVVRDGIQVELNIKPSTCRQITASNLGDAMHQFKLQLETCAPITPVFTQMIKMKRKVLKSCSPKCRQFGCMPSYNVYLPKNDDISKIYVNPETYLYRGGGGHLHLGTYEPTSKDRKDMLNTLKKYDRIIPMIDIICGNFCVMLDTNPLNSERRKNYGRAGEYRKPVYGVEYRTLSNFWLRNYTIFSLVTGLARLAVYIVHDSTAEHDYEGKILSLVDIKDVEKAINTNDAILARKNWNKIKDYLASIISYTETNYISSHNKKQYIDVNYDCYGLNISPKTIPLIDFFLDKGLDYWFGKASNTKILQHWTSEGNLTEIGWERFMENQLYKEYLKVNPTNIIRFTGSHAVE